MADDDIIFLGSTNPSAPQPVTGGSFRLSDMKHHPDHPCLAGVVLHVLEKQGDIDGSSMTFRKANTSVVHIGRRSGFDVDKRSQDREQSSAMFRCAVVSRKHAKIAFSDIGQVCQLFFQVL
jgi:hypothetical protein